MNHSFNTDIAKLVGVNGAVLFENIAFWQLKNEANEKHFHDSHYWTYNSKKAFSEIFEYLTPRQIDTALNKLKDLDMLLVGNYNENRYNHTNWYSIPDEILEKYGYKNVVYDNTKMCNRVTKNVQSRLHETVQTNTYINNTDNKQTNINKKTKTKKDAKYNYLEKCEKIISEYDFSDKVIDNILSYLTARAKLTEQQLRTQLEILAKLNEREQLKSLTLAIGAGYKMMAYPKENNYSKSKPKDDIGLTKDEEQEIWKQNEQFRKDVKDAGGFENYVKKNNMQKF